MLIGARGGLFRVRVGSHLGDEHGVGRDRRAAPPHAVRVDAALGERDAHLVRVRVRDRARVRVRVRVRLTLTLTLTLTSARWASSAAASSCRPAGA